MIKYNNEPTYSKQAEAYLNKQTVKQSARIKKAIQSLPAGDVCKLRTIKNGYRLRVGSIRVLFEKIENNIHVINIDNRGDVYKWKDDFMSAKAQLINTLDYMGENELIQILQYIKDTFLLKPKTWDDIEEDDPFPDEVEIFKEYYANKQ